MSFLDPRMLIADPSARQIIVTQEADLTAGDVKRLNDDELVVFERRSEEEQVMVVTYVAPFARERTDPGTLSESVASIPPILGDGHFIFSPKVNGQNAENIEANVPTQRIAAGPLSDQDRIDLGGFMHLSPTPLIDANRHNPLMRIYVPANGVFQVTWQLRPVSNIAPIVNPYQIGAGPKRVDYAGCAVSIVLMPEADYNRLEERLLAEQNGVGHG